MSDLPNADGGNWRGPWNTARELERLIPVTVAKRDATKDKAERKRLNNQLRSQRYLLKFCKSRAGYVDPAKGSAADPGTSGA